MFVRLRYRTRTQPIHSWYHLRPGCSLWCVTNISNVLPKLINELYMLSLFDRLRHRTKALQNPSYECIVPWVALSQNHHRRITINLIYIVRKF